MRRTIWSIPLVLVLLCTACSAPDTPAPDDTATIAATVTTRWVSTRPTNAPASPPTDASAPPAETVPCTTGFQRPHQESPFQGVSIDRVTLYTKKDNHMFSDVIVRSKTITDPQQIETLQCQLTDAKWRFYPDEGTG